MFKFKINKKTPFFFNCFLIFFVFSLSLSCPFEVQAIIEFEDAVFPELATNGRALAMGNAFICKVDDSASVFYNPAGLGSVRYGHFHLTNLHLETNKALLRTSTGGQLTEVAGNVTKAFDLDGVRQLLLENRGEMVHNRFNFMPNILMRYFSLGYMFSTQKRATIGTEEGALFEFATRRDHGPFAALNISLFGGIIKAGATAVVLNRRELIDEYARDETVDIQDGDYQKGSATVFIAGGRITLPIMFLPTIAATMHNASGAKFSSGTSAGAPETIKSAIDVGFSITPQIFKFTRIHLEVNYKDMGGEHADVSTTRKVTVGAELDIARVFQIRAGYGDGFGCGGLGLRTKRLEVDLTTYAVDTTSSEFRGVEDRRFSLTVSSGF